MLFGLLTIIYIFFPLISWLIYFSPIFASQDIKAPIPKTTIVDPSTIGSLVLSSAQKISGVDYTNAQNWFPTLEGKLKQNSEVNVASYTISIPQLSIKNAIVSTTDYDLSKHLINYPGTAIPPKSGNTVIFGHSTLPQLFNPNDYKTIFATAYTLKVGDIIQVMVMNVLYTYKIYNITVVDPSDTSIFSQNYNTSYLTLVTCTPPGTTWKRLIIKSRIEKI